MKKFALRNICSLVLLSSLCAGTANAWAHLPRPIKANGIALAVDLDSQTLVFKPAKGKKPVLFDWNKETEFKSDGRKVPPSDLKNGTTVEIYYKDVSFHHPLLKQVIWKDPEQRSVTAQASYGSACVSASR